MRVFVARVPETLTVGEREWNAKSYPKCRNGVRQKPFGAMSRSFVPDALVPNISPPRTVIYTPDGRYRPFEPY